MQHDYFWTDGQCDGIDIVDAAYFNQQCNGFVQSCWWHHPKCHRRNVCFGFYHLSMGNGICCRNERDRRPNQQQLLHQPNGGNHLLGTPIRPRTLWRIHYRCHRNRFSDFYRAHDHYRNEFNLYRRQHDVDDFGRNACRERDL